MRPQNVRRIFGITDNQPCLPFRLGGNFIRTFRRIQPAVFRQTQRQSEPHAVVQQDQIVRIFLQSLKKMIVSIKVSGEFPVLLDFFRFADNPVRFLRRIRPLYAEQHIRRHAEYARQRYDLRNVRHTRPVFPFGNRLRGNVELFRQFLLREIPLLT